MSFDEFLRLPSRLSVEASAREDRESLLAQVASRGFVDNYSGMRIAKSGRRFMIRETNIWNLLDQTGHYFGQAATFTAP